MFHLHFFVFVLVFVACRAQDAFTCTRTNQPFDQISILQGFTFLFKNTVLAYKHVHIQTLFLVSAARCWVMSMKELKLQNNAKQKNVPTKILQKWHQKTLLTQSTLYWAGYFLNLALFWHNLDSAKAKNKKPIRNRTWKLNWRCKTMHIHQ